MRIVLKIFFIRDERNYIFWLRLKSSVFCLHNVKTRIYLLHISNSLQNFFKKKKKKILNIYGEVNVGRALRK